MSLRRFFFFLSQARDGGVQRVVFGGWCGAKLHVRLTDLDVRRQAAFVDAGDVFTSEFDVNVGAGVGLRWKSPVGLVRLDIAHGVVTDLKKEWRIHIVIGPDL